MDPLYTRAGATATRLLTKYNQATYILSRAGQTIPSANEWDMPTILPPQSWALQGISRKVSTQYIGRTGLTGSLITASDRQIMVASFADEPKPADVLMVNGKVQTVLLIDKITELGLAWILIIKG